MHAVHRVDVLQGLEGLASDVRDLPLGQNDVLLQNGGQRASAHVLENNLESNNVVSARSLARRRRAGSGQRATYPESIFDLVTTKI